MIKVRLTELENYRQLIYDTTPIFNILCKNEWFQDKAVINIVETIDDAVHVQDDIFRSNYFGTFGPDKISSGAKTLIMALKADLSNYYLKLSSLGDNCFTLLNNIGTIKDVVFYGDCIPNIKDNECNFYIEETGNIVNNAVDFAKECAVYGW